MATMALSGVCILKAGSNVDDSFTGTSAEANWNTLILQAESSINSITRKNWNTIYSTLSADVKYILEDYVSSKAAISAISYNMSGYTSLAEAQTMLDVNRDIASQALKELNDKSKVQAFMEDA